MRKRPWPAWLVLLIGCGEAEPSLPPEESFEPCRTASEVMAACGSDTSFAAMLDADDRAEAIAGKADDYDRLFFALHAFGTGLNTEITVGSPAGQTAVETFVSSEGWDFEDETGTSVAEAVDAWAKVAGAYGGVGIAADAFRYGALRDSGAPCDEVDRAHAHLMRDLDALHRATAITGVPGVIARGYARKDLPGAGMSVETTPLFDDAGNPLPEQKNNGTWREDNSADGSYPDYVWEDSCSRDQLVGWVMGFAASWEVIADDPGFDDATKGRLQEDAAAIARSLMQVRDSGYDLEIQDADGRTTYHGVMHEDGLDRAYIPGASNGFYALLSLGIMSALAYVSEESDVLGYVQRELIESRGLPDLALDNMIGVDLGEGSNFSTYNMAFLGGLLAQRYLCHDEARQTVRQAIAERLYDRGMERQPIEQRQTLYDFTFVLSEADATAYQPLQSDPSAEALERGVDTLAGWPVAPYLDTELINCDEDEVASGTCLLADDTTTVELLGEVGWNDELIARDPLPIGLRPPSNYHWRSNPYRVNGGGDGTRLLPSVDFRFTYWLARWVR